MLPHSSLPGACCSFSTQPQVPEASLLQVFIIFSKHLHQSWCQEDYDSVCPGPVGLGPWDLRLSMFRPLHRASGRNDPSSSPFRQLLATCHWVTPAQQVASPEGPLVGSQPPVAWNWGWRDWPWDQPTQTWEDPWFAWKHESILKHLKRCIKCISVSICKCVYCLFHQHPPSRKSAGMTFFMGRTLPPEITRDWSWTSAISDAVNLQ